MFCIFFILPVYEKYYYRFLYFYEKYNKYLLYWQTILFLNMVYGIQKNPFSSSTLIYNNINVNKLCPIAVPQDST